MAPRFVATRSSQRCGRVAVAARASRDGPAPLGAGRRAAAPGGLAAAVATALVAFAPPDVSALGLGPGIAAAATQNEAVYAGKGYALDCLSGSAVVPMDHQRPAGLSYYQLKAGQIACGREPDARGAALAGVLTLEHAALVLLPLACMPAFHGLLREAEAGREAGGGGAAAGAALLGEPWLYVALGALSLAASGEVAEHTHFNWLFVSLLPSFPNALFYGGLTAGQALLAAALGGARDGWAKADAAVVAASFALQWAAVFATADNGDARLLGVPVPLLWEAVAFGGLTVTSAAFAVKAFDSAGRVGLPGSWGRLAGMVAAYGAGIGFTVGMLSTGNQLLHVPTAASFVAGFLVQLDWLRALIEAEVARSAEPAAQPPLKVAAAELARRGAGAGRR